MNQDLGIRILALQKSSYISICFLKTVPSVGKELFTIGYPLLVRVLIPMTAPPGTPGFFPDHGLTL